MNEIGLKIKQIRNQKGITQEKLSEDAKINLRTLQRIEKGESNPRGETLIRLSKTLNTPLDELIVYGQEENIAYIKMIHFCALVFVIIPLGNIIMPLILWLSKNKRIKDISYYSKKFLNFQITWTMVTFFPMIYLIIGFIFSLNLPLPNFGNIYLPVLIYLFVVFMYLVNGIYILIAGASISEKQRNYFPIAIRFLK